MIAADANEAVRSLFADKLAAGWHPAGLWPYTDEAGSPIFYRVRLDPPKGSDKGKFIRPFHLDGTGWKLGEPPASPEGKPLYRLHELEAHPDETVWIVEGEKCADALAALGLLATTSGSASSATNANWQPLSGRHCVLWPDHDAPGQRYAMEVSTRLLALGAAVEAIDVAALGLSDAGDAADWLALHAEAGATDVGKLARCAIENMEPAEATAVPMYCTKAGQEPARVELIAAAGLAPEPVRWLWPGWLARGKLHVLAGAPGTGKTTIAMNMAAIISTGGAFPDGTRCAPGRVLIWSGEDDPADTLVPRLIAAGADLSRINFVGDFCMGCEREAFDPARHALLLMQAIGDDVSLVVIDPLVSAVAGDSHKNAEVRRSLAPLVELASRCGAALLGITHYSKGTQGRDPLERVSGSLAFGALARVVFGTAKEEGENGSQPTMKLARMKSNIGRDDGGFAYEFEQVEIDQYPGVLASRVVWGDAMEGSARELLGVGPELEDQPQRDATIFLRELLVEGSMKVTAIFREAEQAGYSRDQMKRAKSKLKAQAIKCGMSGGWIWKLPSDQGNAEGRNGSERKRQRSSLPSEGESLPSPPCGVHEPREEFIL